VSSRSSEPNAGGIASGPAGAFSSSWLVHLQGSAVRLRLTKPVHAVMIDDDLVFLDVEADAYFCLPLPQGAAQLESGQLVTDDRLLGEELMGAGLVEEAPADLSAPRPPPRAPSLTARALLERSPKRDTRVRIRHARALLAAIACGLAARRRSFRQLIDVHAMRAGSGEADIERVLADLAVWRRLAPWVPLDGVCLFRSGMLSAFLTALGHRPTWVFGVRTWPFQAHCWLQVDDVALDDEAERLCAFTPILAV